MTGTAGWFISATPWTLSYKDEPRKSPHPAGRNFGYELSDSTAQTAWLLCHRSQTHLCLAQRREQGWGVSKRALPVLGALPAQQNQLLIQLKPAKLCSITLVYHGWSLSLTADWFFPHTPTVIIGNSGCPVTSAKFKAHLNPSPLSASKVNLCSCQVHHVQSEKYLLSYSTHSLNSIIKGQPLTPGQNHLPEGSDLSNIALLRSRLLLDCNHPPPQETNAYCCEWSQILT